MQYKIINVKKLIVSLYLITPSIFYFFFYLYALVFGDIRAYFFGKQVISASDFLSYFQIHLLIGAMLFFILKKTNYRIFYKSVSNINYDILILLTYISVTYISIPYLNDLIYALLIISIASYRPGKFAFLSLFSIAIIQIIFFQDRFPIIFISTIYFLPYLSRKNYKTLILIAVLAVFFLVYILQPLKGGSLPSTNDFFDLLYFIKHMYPILIGAYSSANINIDGFQIFSESIPMFKSLFNYPSIIEVVAYESLSREAILNGTRLGSNSTIFLNNNGYFILIILFLLMYTIISIFKARIFYNSVLFFFILYGPYFLRRFFGSYVLDFILLTFMAFLIFLMIFLLKNKRSH